MRPELQISLFLSDCPKGAGLLCLPIDSQVFERCNSTAAVGAGRGGGAGSTSFSHILQFHPVMHVGAAGIVFVLASPAPGGKACV